MRISSPIGSQLILQIHLEYRQAPRLSDGDEHQQLCVQDWAGHGAKPRASGLIHQVQVLVALVMIYLTNKPFHRSLHARKN